MNTYASFDFATYQKQLEIDVIEKGVARGDLGRPLFVSTRNGKLYRSMGALFGYVVYSDRAFAIDYYGYVKKSTALVQDMTERARTNPGVQISSVRTKVVYFSALKIEYIAELAPELVAGFPFFKKLALSYRGFRNVQCDNTVDIH